jgi:beta-N-acetylhexosaminidase
MRTAHVVFTGIPGTRLDASTESLLRAAPPGGVVLFQRNVGTAEELRQLVRDLRRCLPETLLAIDAEGGRVDRLRQVVGGAPAAEHLAAQPSREARRAGKWVGRALRLFDLDLDFAPVVDLDRGRPGNALDGRYLGSNPRAVVGRASSFLAGLQAEGVGGCLKHFPGLGGAGEDTHHRFSVVPLTREELRLDLAPFARLLPAAGAVMVSHAIYPAYDPEERPSTLSPPVIGGLLRGTLGFPGLVFGDDLEMKALDEWGDLPERCAAALAAGCDVLPVCREVEALPAIAARLADPRLRPRLDEARQRIGAYRRQVLARRRGRRDWVERGSGELEASLAQLRRAFASFAPA